VVFADSITAMFQTAKDSRSWPLQVWLRLFKPGQWLRLARASAGQALFV